MKETPTFLPFGFFFGMNKVGSFFLGGFGFGGSPGGLTIGGFGGGAFSGRFRDSSVGGGGLWVFDLSSDMSSAKSASFRLMPLTTRDPSATLSASALGVESSIGGGGGMEASTLEVVGFEADPVGALTGVESNLLLEDSVKYVLLWNYS